MLLLNGIGILVAIIIVICTGFLSQLGFGFAGRPELGAKIFGICGWLALGLAAVFVVLSLFGAITWAMDLFS